MDKEIKDSRYKTASMTFDAGLTLYLVSGEWASACLLSFYPFIPLSCFKTPSYKSPAHPRKSPPGDY